MSVRSVQVSSSSACGFDGSFTQKYEPTDGFERIPYVPPAGIKHEHEKSVTSEILCMRRSHREVEQALGSS
jgi:hypothetical protein